MKREIDMAEINKTDQADALFKQLHAKLPFNRQSVYLMVQAKDCTIFLPSRFPNDAKRSKIEKQHWQTIVELAEY